MRTYAQNGWFHRSEFLRAAAVIHLVATTEGVRWLDAPNAKYVQLYVDQRTGDFLIRDTSGVALTPEQVYEMFPELRSNG